MALKAVIRTDFERVPPEVVQGWQPIPSPVASDAVAGTTVLDHRFKPLWSGARICGPALTVKTMPGQNPIVSRAIELAQPGDVLVIDAEENCEYSLIGGNIGLWAARRGLGGVLVAGAIRDIDEIRATGLGVIGLGITPRASRKSEGGSIGVPVAVGGVVIQPGDLVVGDADGVVVVPRAEAAAALTRAQAREQQDEAVRQRVLAGESMYHVYGVDKLFEG